MTNEELDRILSSKDEDILPSSGLIASVMEGVRSEADMPPPIPFPWKHALPGLAAAGAALVCLLTLLLDQVSHSTFPLPQAADVLAWRTPVIDALGWSLLALALSLFLVKLSMRWAAR
jgi:hypothetical protein